MEPTIKIGKKLKKLRQAKALTQEELANRSYLTKGFISQLERDLTSPSIATLKSILDVLGENLASFFQEAESHRVVCGKKQRVLHSSSTDEVKIELILPQAHGRLMDPVIVTIQPGQKTEREGSHEGEEFGFLLRGTVGLWLDNECYRLKKGDCFYFKSNQEHWIENHGKSVAEILWVVSPPVF